MRAILHGRGSAAFAAAGLWLLVLPLLGACGTAPRGAVPGYAAAGGGRHLSCVPFARARSGVSLAGDAWQWWEAAEGRYDRSRAPRPGSVLVMQRTSRLPQGHLAVVTRIVSAREIRVDHANWAPGGSAARGLVARDQPVVDVSPAGDWSLVRVWYPGVNDYGRTGFPTFGFVHPHRRMAEAR